MPRTTFVRLAQQPAADASLLGGAGAAAAVAHRRRAAVRDAPVESSAHGGRPLT